MIKLIREEITKRLGFSNAPSRIVDSMPIPVCHFDRAKFYKSLREYASYGYCASKKDFATDLKLWKNIDLIPIKQNNSKDQYPKPFRQLIFKLR